MSKHSHKFNFPDVNVCTENFENKITALIKTFDREDCLVKLIQSIRKYYKQMPILVINDGSSIDESKLQYSNVSIINTEFDVGLSAGRNIGVNNIETKYFLLLDDDFYFTRQTNIQTLYQTLETTDFSIAGGAVLDHGYKILRQNGNIYIKNDSLYLDCNIKKYHQDYPVYEVIRNFFLAETDIIKKNLWDENLKLAEHMDFFLRAKKNGLMITYNESVRVNHYPVRSDNYAQYRERSIYYKDKMLEKHGVVRKKTIYAKRNLMRRVTDKLAEQLRRVKVVIMGKYR